MKIERINDWFARQGRWMVQKRWLVLSLFILVFAIGFTGLRYFKVSASWENYFLEDDPMLVKTKEFKDIFGNDNFAAVLTQCDNSFMKENLELIRELTNEMMDSISYADKITSLTDIEFMVGNEEGMTIEQIVPDLIPTDAASLETIRRKAYMKPHIAERLVSKDGTLSWIILKLRTFPKDSVWNKGKNAVSPEVLTGNELAHIITKDKYQKLHPKGTGLPYVTAMKMKWIGKEMPRVMGIAALVSILILLLITRSLRGVVVPLITAAGSIVIVYGLLGYVGMTIDSGMMMIPMLLAFAVSIAYNIHIFSYFKRQFLLHGERRRAVEETVGEMGWPVLFSALTTFAALLSFLAIPMQPMRFIGIATSSCVMLAFFIAITLMPVLLSFGKNGKPHPKVQETGGRWLDHQLGRLGESVLRHGTLILWIAGLLTAALIYQFTKIETAFDIEREPISHVIDMLKIKGSYGEVGNDQIGGNRRFIYNATVIDSGSYDFGKTAHTEKGLRVGDWANPNVGWERAKKMNAGVEISFFNALKIQADYFSEKREGIFLERASLPLYIGVSTKPYVNVGKMKNHGFDTSLEYNQRVGQVRLSGKANFTYAHNTIIDNDQPDWKYPYLNRRGQMLWQQYGLVAAGLFESQADIDSWPTQTFGEVKPGDIKYIDINGDGKIDTNDEKPIGWAAVPEIVYGFGLSAAWKGLDCSVFFQGAGHVTLQQSGSAIQAFSARNMMESGVYEDIYYNHWSEDNPNPNAKYPRLSIGSNKNNFRNSTFWQKDMSYLRLKTVEIGYNFPSKWIDPIHISGLRIYLSGVNLLTFSKFKLWDPEVLEGQGANYPANRIFNFGININL